MKPAPGGAAFGLLVDALLGDPPDQAHPVAWFGRMMDSIEDRIWADRPGPGVAHATTGLVTGWAAGRILRSAGAATAIATGARSLMNTARCVATAVDDGDIERARHLLPALVGRDPSHLDEKEICRATVESVAENTVDAIVAPALYAAAGGAPAVLAHRAVNTMDAMVGHRSSRYSRYGRAPARLDDLANWLPARATALLVAAVRPRHAGEVLAVVRRDAPAHPSPNAGVAEAAFAAALGVTLGGVNRYGDRVEERPAMGNGPPPSIAEIEAAVRLTSDIRSVLVLGLGAWELARRRRRKEHG